MREDLLKQPDMDFQRMSKRMRDFLRERDYDAYYFEAIPADDDAFDK